MSSASSDSHFKRMAEAQGRSAGLIWRFRHLQVGSLLHVVYHLIKVAVGGTPQVGSMVGRLDPPRMGVAQATKGKIRFALGARRMKRPPLKKQRGHEPSQQRSRQPKKRRPSLGSPTTCPICRFVTWLIMKETHPKDIEAPLKAKHKCPRRPDCYQTS
jgi:hypothetical protein